MTEKQRIIKYAALIFAAFLIISILGGIIGAVGKIAFVVNSVLTVGEMTGSTSTNGEQRDFELEGIAADLEIELNAAALVIKVGDAFSVTTDHPHITVKESKDALKITEKETGVFGREQGGTVTVTLPADYAFDEAEIDTGAGKLDIETLSAGEFSLNIGAGDVHIGTLAVSKEADIDGGAGQVTIDGGEINNLEIDLGVGRFDCTAAVLGNSEINGGIGEVQLTLLGDKDAYCIRVDKDVGTATVDGETVDNDNRIGNGQNNININGGVGAIKVDFQE